MYDEKNCPGGEENTNLTKFWAQYESPVYASVEGETRNFRNVHCIACRDIPTDQPLYCGLVDQPIGAQEMLNSEGKAFHIERSSKAGFRPEMIFYGSDIPCLPGELPDLAIGQCVPKYCPFGERVLANNTCGPGKIKIPQGMNNNSSIQSIILYLNLTHIQF